MSDDPLARIAAALDRIAPPPSPMADPLAHRAYVWRGHGLAAARAFAPLPLDLLTGIDQQKAILVDNLRRLAAGLPAHDTLLWGARGSGKSALVKSAIGAIQDEAGALALIEVAGDTLDDLPALFDVIADLPRAYAIFVDDLGFASIDTGPRKLRSLLEGGAEARPANARLFVTSNRRHIVPREMAVEQTAVNARDVADDTLALSDRFGLSLGFHVADQAAYLAMVEAYARAHHLPYDPAAAIAWATTRGHRSGRVAWAYVVDVAGKAGRGL